MLKVLAIQKVCQILNLVYEVLIRSGDGVSSKIFHCLALFSSSRTYSYICGKREKPEIYLSS